MACDEITVLVAGGGEAGPFAQPRACRGIEVCRTARLRDPAIAYAAIGADRELETRGA